MKNKFLVNVASIVMAAGLLVACGEGTGERALSGGAIGAGTGAVVGAVTGMGPGTGALIGGALGAGTGAVTKKSDINLGKPIWK
ncbi:MAG: hypothetical protein EB059_07035 [Alphaproteobacteria bacterium]|nr:hypothetical protein [Alphaproteobacteria bacterium]